MADFQSSKVAIIGLGYVGLPLAISISKAKKTQRQAAKTENGQVVGFDINKERIDELRECVDRTREVETHELKECQDVFRPTDCEADIDKAIFYIVTVPTPIDAVNRPDLSPINDACVIVGNCLARSNEYYKTNGIKPIVVFESTVYPGLTTEFCSQKISEASGLEYNIDYFLGYSPERIVPGDKQRKLENIVKITSGSTDAAANEVSCFYRNFIKAGIVEASSIEAAEAAKILENTQRDVNIALINEFSMLFQGHGLSTNEVVSLASTKWNFMQVRPGLVGGHCIGVDPYYLIHKSEQLGGYAEIVSAARRINNRVAEFIVQDTVCRLSAKGIPIKEAKILVLGLTFKEDCGDLRTTKSIDVIEGLREYGAHVVCADPVADAEEAENKLGVRIQTLEDIGSDYSCILLLVPHQGFISLGSEAWKRILIKDGYIYDMRGALNGEKNDPSIVTA